MLQPDMFEILEQAAIASKRRYGSPSTLREFRQRWEIVHCIETLVKYVSVEECGTILSEQGIERSIKRFFELSGIRWE